MVYPSRFFLLVFVVLLPCVGLATDPPPQAVYQYLSIDIANDQGLLGRTSLADINDHGEVVGGFIDSSGPGFLLSTQLQYVPIRCREHTGGPQDVQPRSINRRGDITGLCGVDGQGRGFLRLARQHIILELIDAQLALLTETIGINDHEHIVGDYQAQDGTYHGFFFSFGLFDTIDVPFPGATLTALTGINNEGEVVGFYLDSGGLSHGFRYALGSFTLLDVPGALGTQLLDINDHLQIVGLYVGEDYLSHSFLYDQGTITTLAVPFAGARLTQVSGINNHGQIVGRWVDAAPGDEVNPVHSHGFLGTRKPRVP